MKRRDLIVLAGAVGVAAGFSAVLRARGTAYTFAPIPGAPGFRRVDQGMGGISAVPGILTGFERSSEADRAGQADVRGNLCRALFGKPADGDGLPIAVFGDYYCPNCATLEASLRSVVAADGGLRLVFHELPILHPRSEELARVALAAGEQGAHEQAHNWLMTRRLPPGPGPLQAFGRDLGLDPRRLAADLRSRDVSQALERSAALAAVLGIPATPGLVIGSTVVLGALPKRDLQRLIALERNRGSICG